MIKKSLCMEMEAVVDRLDMSAKAYPIKALAPLIKTELTATKAESTLRAELNQQPGYKLGLITAIQILAHTGDLTPLDMVESFFNRTAFDLPTVTPTNPAPLMKMVSKLSKEFSETVQEVATAMSDGHLDPDELKKCLKELDDLIQAAIEFKGMLLFMEKDGD